MTVEDQAKKDILCATAKKFFPGWDVECGVVPHPWARLSQSTRVVEVHVNRAISLDNFEEEAWHQFKRLLDDVLQEDVDDKSVPVFEE